jgi:hypothetical protein
VTRRPLTHIRPLPARCCCAGAVLFALKRANVQTSSETLMICDIMCYMPRSSAILSCTPQKQNPPSTEVVKKNVKLYDQVVDFYVAIWHNKAVEARTCSEK